VPSTCSPRGEGTADHVSARKHARRVQPFPPHPCSKRLASPQRFTVVRKLPLPVNRVVKFVLIARPIGLSGLQWRTEVAEKVRSRWPLVKRLCQISRKLP
jgi:hypothetical protein